MNTLNFSQKKRLSKSDEFYEWRFNKDLAREMHYQVGWEAKYLQEHLDKKNYSIKNRKLLGEINEYKSQPK